MGQRHHDGYSLRGQNTRILDGLIQAVFLICYNTDRKVKHMKKNQPVYITGHQHPDTDSIASAIGYAFFKRTQGIQAIPCRLGDINNESAYLLKRFGFHEPQLLRDARITLAGLNIDEPYGIKPETTVRETIRLMHETSRNSFAVLNEDRTIAGYVSKSDLANIGLGDTAAEIELLKHTSAEEIASAIDGTIIFSDEQMHINGKTSIVAHNQAGVSSYEVQDRIVIVGNDPAAQKELILKGAGMLIIVWASGVEESVLEEAKAKHCPVIISGHGTMNTSRYLFLAPPVRLIMTLDPISFRDDEYAEEAGSKMARTRFRSYPVVDKDGILKGYISRFHILNHKNKKVILVDHNEFSQSVRNVEKAQILEVIDHHRINDFKTSQPVSFRNEIIGSTATIVASMFRENQIPLPANLAGLLLGAVLSDTLVFQSPTTTRKDIDTANILAALADLDIETFSKEMFTASAASAKQSIYEMTTQDIKFFNINGMRTMVSQVIVASIDGIRKRESEIYHDMQKLVEKKELDLLVVCFTSVLENGSVIYAYGEKAEKCTDIFPDLPGETHSLQRGIFSRKKQIVPMLMEYFI